MKYKTFNQQLTKTGMYYWQQFSPYAQWLPIGAPSNMFYPQINNSNWQFPQMFYQPSFEYYPPTFSQSTAKLEETEPTLVVASKDTHKQVQKTQTKMKVEKYQNYYQTSRVSRNIKANILKYFIKSIKKDATQILLTKKLLNSDYPVKKFIQILTSNLPKQGKYIRTKTVIQLCRSEEDKTFSLILRTVLRNFLKGDYRIFVVLKRKNSQQYLKACRQIEDKLINWKKQQNFCQQ